VEGQPIIGANRGGGKAPLRPPRIRLGQAIPIPARKTQGFTPAAVSWGYGAFGSSPQITA